MSPSGYVKSIFIFPAGNGPNRVVNIIEGTAIPILPWLSLYVKNGLKILQLRYYIFIYYVFPTREYIFFLLSYNEA